MVPVLELSSYKSEQGDSYSLLYIRVQGRVCTLIRLTPVEEGLPRVAHIASISGDTENSIRIFERDTYHPKLNLDKCIDCLHDKDTVIRLLRLDIGMYADPKKINLLKDLVEMLENDKILFIRHQPEPEPEKGELPLVDLEEINKLEKMMDEITSNLHLSIY